MGNNQHNNLGTTSTSSANSLSAMANGSKKKRSSAKNSSLKKKLDFKPLEKALINIDSLIELTKNTIRFVHEQLYAQIAYENLQAYEQKILHKQSELKRQLERDKHKCKFGRVIFVECTKNFTQILNDSYYPLNKFVTIQQKINYLKFYNEFTIVDTNSLVDNCYNYIVLPMSRHKFFYCMAVFKKKSLMKITDESGRELCRRSIDPKHFYIQFCTYANRIVGLYEDAKTRMSVIEVYTDELKLVASKLFNIKFDKLVCMSRNEIVCKTENNFYPYVFFNLNLEPTFSFRVLNKTNEESHGNEVILLGSNANNLYLYHTRKKFLKVLSRLDGKSMFAVNFDKAISLESISNVCLHESGCLVFKCNATRRLNCYEHEAGRWCESTSVSNLNVHFRTFEIDCFNNFYSCDNLNKKIYFL